MFSVNVVIFFILKDWSTIDKSWRGNWDMQDVKRLGHHAEKSWLW